MKPKQVNDFVISLFGREYVHMKVPLTFAEIVNEIVRLTTLSREEVEYRVWMEAMEPGWNVLQDVVKFGVTPHEYDENMQLLYSHGDGFIFETLVFWSRPSRMRWTQHVLDRIHRCANRSGIEPNLMNILILGDGTGNDTLNLVKNGFSVFYYDVPGSKTFDFAIKRFDSYGVLGRYVKPLETYERCFDQQYEIVMSFEVLEHLPQPLKAIKDMAFLVKIGGIALITEDFGDVTDHLPTHLYATSQYYGKTPFLFLNNLMVLSWYGRDPLFRPCEYVRRRKVSFADSLNLLADRNVRRRYRSHYTRRLLHLAGRVS